MSLRACLVALTVALLPGCFRYTARVEHQDVREGTLPPIVPVVDAGSGRMHVSIEQADLYGSGVEVVLQAWPGKARWQSEDDEHPPVALRMRCTPHAFGPWWSTTAYQLFEEDPLKISVTTHELCPAGLASGTPIELEIKLPPLCIKDDCEHVLLRLGPAAFGPRPPPWPEPAEPRHAYR
ncbi:MAG: hypothetical protein OXT09_00420 [Myxococcales bacterium]|nr:hypothetical protein [Myxococcales bacterium]